MTRKDLIRLGRVGALALALPAWMTMLPCLSLAAEAAPGAAKCQSCHEDKAKSFSATKHGKAAHYGYKDAGCESCHGPGDKHAESGDKAAIVNPAKVSAEEASAKCLECHGSDKNRRLWQGSVHESQGLGCVACHKVHGGNDRLLAKKAQADVCYKCHQGVRSDVMKRSKHPLRDSSAPGTDGKMTCSSCHNVHGALGEKLVDATHVNDKCYECHAEKKAPMLWEHSPVKEDCLTCHKAHGSSNDKMLVTKVPRLCQQCHMQGRHQTGTLDQNSIYQLNRGCLNCHPMVHGTNNPSGPVMQR